ncbi:hypothetical protein [Acanthopleuribacter pedis]|uniref:Uncharacterized protein n=1 Tax=Acanthopleuribacter pedis TaxID=442870 RepID=A0A8J7QD73_9BACT|nr:hypothetical protein [Acanthopleuribacter pedis]MBO1316913.1 hypothetical protein [Acanthopleuribacter pedis]
MVTFFVQSSRLLCLFMVAGWVFPVAAQTVPWSVPSGEGFYKDVLINGGPGVSGVPQRHFVAMLGLEVETLSAAECSPQYETFQTHLIGCSSVPLPDNVSCNSDPNGRLLYPDGSPRFRLLVTGGAASEQYLDQDGDSAGFPDALCHERDPDSTWYHAGGRHHDYLRAIRNDQFQTGEQVIQQFVAAGGSFSGFCAGAFLAEDLKLNLFKSFPFDDEFRQVTILPTSPLFDYMPTTLKKHYIRSAGGGYVTWDDEVTPPEILAIGGGYDLIWASKADTQTGRVVVSGSHPEESRDPYIERLTAAMYTYALDGVGTPRVKGALQNGITRYMDKGTHERIPDETKIGDKQYHHFSFEVTNQRYLKLDVVGEPGTDFHVYLRKGEPAFDSTTPSFQKVVGPGAQKTLVFDNLSIGTWYVGVECVTTVTLNETTNIYDDPHGVLNGIAYHVTATWSAQPIPVREFSAFNVPASVTRTRELNCSWQATGFDPGALATVALVSDSGAVTVLNNAYPLQEENDFTFYPDQPAGRYFLRVTANQNPEIQLASPWLTLAAARLTLGTLPSSYDSFSDLNWTWDGEAHLTEVRLYDQAGNVVWHEQVWSEPGSNRTAFPPGEGVAVRDGVFRLVTQNGGVSTVWESQLFTYPSDPFGLPPCCDLGGLATVSGYQAVVLNRAASGAYSPALVEIGNATNTAQTIRIHLGLEGQPLPSQPLTRVGDYSISTRRYAVGPSTYTLYPGQSMTLSVSYLGTQNKPPLGLLVFENNGEFVVWEGQSQIPIIPAD